MTAPLMTTKEWQEQRRIERKNNNKLAFGIIAGTVLGWLAHEVYLAYQLAEMGLL